jgi:hypothetical protein
MLASASISTLNMGLDDLQVEGLTAAPSIIHNNAHIPMHTHTYKHKSKTHQHTHTSAHAHTKTHTHTHPRQQGLDDLLAAFDDSNTRGTPPAVNDHREGDADSDEAACPPRDPDEGSASGISWYSGVGRICGLR